MIKYLIGAYSSGINLVVDFLFSLRKTDVDVVSPCSATGVLILESPYCSPAGSRLSEGGGYKFEPLALS